MKRFSCVILFSLSISALASFLLFRILNPGRVAKRDGTWMDLQTGAAFSERDGFSTSGRNSLRTLSGIRHVLVHLVRHAQKHEIAAVG